MNLKKTTSHVCFFGLQRQQQLLSMNKTQFLSSPVARALSGLGLLQLFDCDSF